MTAIAKPPARICPGCERQLDEFESSPCYRCKTAAVLMRRDADGNLTLDEPWLNLTDDQRAAGARSLEETAGRGMTALARFDAALDAARKE